jgi:hypothetical protein
MGIGHGKIHKGNNKLDCQVLILLKFHYLQSFNVKKFDANWCCIKVLLHVQNNCGQCLKNKFKCIFWLSNVHHSFSKLDIILILRIIFFLKWVKLIEKTDLNAFISNVHLTLKIMKFENVFLIKFIHFYVKHGCII